MTKTTLSTLLAVVLGSISSNADAFTLSSGNATVTGDLFGLSSWSHSNHNGNANLLAEQTWWFNATTNMGSTPFNYELADYDHSPVETSQSAKDATVEYDFNAELGFDVRIDYSLSGGTGTTSSLSEDVLFTNNSGGIASITLYQYTDFDLDGYLPYDPSGNNAGNGTNSFNYGQNDTITQLFDNTVEQTNGSTSVLEQATVVPFPSTSSVGQALALTDALWDGTVAGTVTANGDSFTGDAAWIWAYTFDIADGDTFSISKSMLLDTPAVVPVPAAVWLFGSGLLGIIGIARRRS